MNRRLILAFLFAATVGGAFFLWRGKTSDTEPPSAARVLQETEPKDILGVEQFMRAVDSYRGPVRLEGVVSAVAPEERALTLIDVAELERCGVVTCAPLSLLVRWDGEMPTVRDVVQLSGEVSESESKLFFLARALEKVELKQAEAP